MNKLALIKKHKFQFAYPAGVLLALVSGLYLLTMFLVLPMLAWLVINIFYPVKKFGIQKRSHAVLGSVICLGLVGAMPFLSELSKEAAQYESRIKALPEAEQKAIREARKAQEEAGEQQRREQEEQDWREASWIEEGKTAVKRRLKDPSSAEFRDVYFFRGKDNVPVACGQVNSKNSFGGYTGFKFFISAGQADLTFLEQDMEPGEFKKSWNRFCIK